MRAIVSFVSLLVVLAVVAVTIRNQLRATSKFVPTAASGVAGAASLPFGGTSSPTVSQFQQELDRTMKQAAEQAAQRGSAAEAP